MVIIMVMKALNDHYNGHLAIWVASANIAQTFVIGSLHAGRGQKIFKA